MTSPMYEQDFYAWTQEQAALLREGASVELDWLNLAEEVESLGKRDRRELGYRLQTLLLHLLKWQWQPTERSGSWRSTIREQRSRLGRLLRQSPSLAPLVPQTLQEEYDDAWHRASEETGLPLTTFPDVCPWTGEQVLDAEFFPDAGDGC